MPLINEEPIHSVLWENGSLTQSMSLILQACMRGKFNIFVSAEDDAGLAELVKHLCSCIGRDVDSMDGITSGCADLGDAKLLDVLKNRLPGSILSARAESPAKGLLQLEARVREADPSLSRRAAKELICSSFEVVVQTARMKDDTWFAATEPSWRITNLAELIWVSDSEEFWCDAYESGEGYYGLSNMYFFDDKTGRFVGSGLPPKFFDRLELARIPFQFSWLAGTSQPISVGSLNSEEAKRSFDTSAEMSKGPQMSVAFAKRAIKAGQMISSDDFEIKSVSASQAPPARELYLALDGKKAKVDLCVGAIIKRSDVDT